MFGVRGSGFGFRGSGFGFRASGSGFWISGFECRMSGFGFRVRASGSGFQDSGSGFQVLGSGLHVSGFGFRFSVFGLRGAAFGGGCRAPCAVVAGIDVRRRAQHPQARKVCCSCRQMRKPPQHCRATREKLETFLVNSGGGVEDHALHSRALMSSAPRYRCTSLIESKGQNLALKVLYVFRISGSEIREGGGRTTHDSRGRWWCEPHPSAVEPRGNN